MARTFGPAAINGNDVNAYIEDYVENQSGMDARIMGCDMSSTRRFRSGRNRTSSFLNSSHLRRWAGILDQHPQPTYQPIGNGWGPRVQVDWNRAPRSACAHGRGDHSDSA